MRSAIQLRQTSVPGRDGAALMSMNTVPKAHCPLARESERGVDYSNTLRACALSAPMSSQLDKGNTHRDSCTAHRWCMCVEQTPGVPRSVIELHQFRYDALVLP